MMSGIKSKNTSPELMVRKALHSHGFRFRLHEKTLPGKPDIVLPKYKAVIFVNGCFWHGHNCHLFRLPKSNIEFWNKKITRNIEIDANAKQHLKNLNWRVAIIWECSLKGRTKIDFNFLISQIDNWLKSSTDFLEIKGYIQIHEK